MTRSGSGPSEPPSSGEEQERETAKQRRYPVVCWVGVMSGGFSRVVGAGLPPERDRGGGNGGGGAGGGGGGGDGQVIRNQYEDTRRRAEKKKREFKQRMEIEKCRWQMGAEETNYITLLQRDWDFRTSRYDYIQIAKMLKDIGINKESVVAFNRDPHRPGQTEIILKPELDKTIEEFTKALEEKYPNYELHEFGYRIETIRVKGLPLTANYDDMKKKVADAIRPYVSKVVNVSVGKWRLFGENKDENTEAYIEEKLDGNYHVQVEPISGRAVPQFLPVGTEKAQAQLEYVKGNYYFEKQCNACFKTGHLRNDYDQCEGPISWEEYANTMRTAARDEFGEDVVPISNEEKLQQQVKKLQEDIEAMGAMTSNGEEKLKSLEEERQRIVTEKQILEERKNVEVDQLTLQLREKEKEKKEEKEAMTKKINEVVVIRETLEKKVENKEEELVSLKESLTEKVKEMNKVKRKKEEVEKEKQNELDQMAEKYEKLQQE